VVVSEQRDRLPAADADAVVWHELECGGYRADLALWSTLAAAAGGGESPAPILDVGAGSGRVTLELARAGHELTALDFEPRLLRALARRAQGLAVQTVHADAREFTLARRDYALCIAPMQTVQLLGGAAERIAFMRCARAHLRPGALLACAIVTALEPFDCRAGSPGPTPECTRVDGTLYVSRAVRVHVGAEKVLIERERTIHPAGRGARARPPQRDAIELDRVSVAELRREGSEAGFTPTRTRSIAATDQHVCGSVVMLRA
jgi:SAM-dependent methyltransferase